jgi:protein-arginine kinase activator protein McsA
MLILPEVNETSCEFCQLVFEEQDQVEAGICPDCTETFLDRLLRSQEAEQESGC